MTRAFKNLSGLSGFEQAALGDSESAEANDLINKALIPETSAPVQVISKVFTFQSYFDSTLLSKALLAQPQGQAIVPSTMAPVQMPGYAVGLAPSSQTPVAVQFQTGGQSGNSQAMILTPGQIVRPHGMRSGGRSGSFSGFNWGLPYGWLGGGHASLVVFSTPDASINWAGGNSEVIFHRARYPIKQPSDLTGAGSFNNAPKNWPMRFPWSQALKGSNSVSQQGKASLSVVDPTRTLLVLRGLTTLATAASMRIAMQATNEVGLDSAGDVSLTTLPLFEDVTWPTWTSFGTSGNMATQVPAIMYTGILARVAADDGGVVFIDLSGTAALTGLFVDVVRYGRLG